MRPEPLKLAGIVTVLFGGMSCLSVAALGAELPAVAAGSVVPLADASPDAAGDGHAAGAANLPYADTAVQADAVWHAMVRIASSAPDALNGARDGALSGASAELYAASARGASAQAVMAGAQVEAPMDAQADARTDVQADVTREAPVAAADKDAVVGRDAAIDTNVVVTQVLPPGTNASTNASTGASLDVNPVGKSDVVVTMSASPKADVPDVAPQADVAVEPSSADATVADVATKTVPVARSETKPAPIAVVPPSQAPAASSGHPTHQLASKALTLNTIVAIATTTPAPQAVPASSSNQPVQPVVSTAAQNSVDVHTAESRPVVVAQAPATNRAAKDDSGGWNDEKVALVDNDRLDSMRGGFETPSGLMVSFGITREAFVNGTLVASQSVSIPDVAHMTAQQAQMLVAVNSAGLIQNGTGNVVQQGVLPQLGGTVIQNTLSNQQIQALTTISTTVNSLAMFQGLNIANTLNNALTSAIHPR